MPLLWHKSKVAQLSGLVSDLRSRPRRSSLLLQTGFPASLVDLVVKNHSRLKKPSPSSSSSPSKNKNKKKNKKIERSPPADSASPSSVISSSSDAPIAELSLQDSSRCEIGEELRKSELSCSGSDEEVKHVVGVSGSRCFSLLIKLFFVLVLALGTKEIAVGITASAFLLFFIEFARKRSPFRSSGGLDLNRVDGIRRNLLPLDSVEAEPTSNRGAFEDDDVQAIESDLDLFKGPRRLECPENELKSGILAVGDDGDLVKVEKGRNRKLGSSIFKKKLLHKLVPNKFRRSKNGKVSEEGRLDTSSEVAEFKQGVEEETEEDSQEAKDEEISTSVASNNTSLVSSGEIGLTRKNARKEIEWNSGHLVSFVIVLVGLVGGRIMALILTVTWLLLVKSVQAAWGQLQEQENV